MCVPNFIAARLIVIQTFQSKATNVNITALGKVTGLPKSVSFIIWGT